MAEKVKFSEKIEDLTFLAAGGYVKTINWISDCDIFLIAIGERQFGCAWVTA